VSVKANDLLTEYQNYALEKDKYEATVDEWAAFGKKALDAMYDDEREIKALTEKLATAERRLEIESYYLDEAIRRLDDGDMEFLDAWLMNVRDARLAAQEPADD